MIPLPAALAALPLLAPWAAAASTASTVPTACVEPLPDWELVRREDWYFDSWEELEFFHRRSYHCAQPRIRDHWTPLPGGGAAAVTERGAPPDVARVPLVVPQAFLDATVAHVEEMLARGAARYLFFADLNHNHMHMDKARVDRLYGRAWSEGRWKELLEGVMGDPELRCVYHTQELMREKIKPREFLGRYGPRPAVEPLDHLGTEDRIAAVGDHYGLLGIQLRAHPLGAFALKDGTRFDISFQGGDWDEGMREIGAEKKPSPAWPIGWNR